MKKRRPADTKMTIKQKKGEILLLQNSISRKNNPAKWNRRQGEVENDIQRDIESGKK